MLSDHNVLTKVQENSHVSSKVCAHFVKHHRFDDLHQLYIKQVPASHGYINRFRLF